MLAPHIRISEQLPEGWLPPNLVLQAFAQRNVDETWEVVLPEFTIVGVGDSLHEAVDEANELLYDYFRLCAEEGQAFEKSYRPIPARWAAEIAAKAAVGSVVRRINRARHRRGRNGAQRLNLPVHAANC